MKKIQLVLAMAVLVGLVPAAKAQIGLYAAFSGTQLTNEAHEPWFYGPTVGGYLDAVHFPIVNFGADMRFSFLGAGGNPSATSGLIGPRAVLHLPAIPLRPYGEALAGAQNVTMGEGAAHSNKLYFEYGAVAGVDFTIFPRIDWRVIEYQHTWSQGGGPQRTMLSTGVVLRIPFLY